MIPRVINSKHASVILKPGREKSIWRRHPWIFSGAVDHADHEIASGATVDVFSSSGCRGF